jgi:hypothetical protein
MVNIMGLDKFTKTEFFPIMEGPNRGKRSIGLDLESEGGREVLAALVKTADVFVTNFREATRKKTKARGRGHSRDKPERHLFPRYRSRGPRGRRSQRGL